MSTINGTRKYSIIEQPVATNGLLNQAASQSVSHYQQCSALKARLLRIRNFRPYFTLSTNKGDRKSTDPVTELWDLFSLGISLCYLYNLLPKPATPIAVSTAVDGFDPANKKHTQRAIALFAMKINAEMPGCQPFTVTDLFSRESTNGLLKVIQNVVMIVDRLPPDLFEEQPTSPPSFISHTSTESILSEASSVSSETPSHASNIIREMVHTERKYVQDLEFMQKYSQEMFQSHLMDQDTIHFLFPGLNQLLNFQRTFLIRLETTAEQPWADQRWGSHFIEKENEFVVYEPYCANYTRAVDICLENGKLTPELPAFLIKPIQRLCKYPLLLAELIKASTTQNNPHLDELKAGCDAAKRILSKINEAQRRADNEVTVKGLEARIEDWKGHHLHNFGELLLENVFTVTKSEVDREYHVFLFEKIILCCKEAVGQPPVNGKKINKNNSILKKSPAPLNLPNAQPLNKKKDTPLLLKGRIFLNNVTQAVATSPRASMASSLPNPYALQVWWRGDEELEFFTLRCTTVEVLNQWESQVNRLIRDAATRRASEHNGASRLTSIQNSTNPRQATSMYNNSTSMREKSNSMVSPQSAYSNPQIHGQGRRNSPYGSDEQLASAGISPGPYMGGPHGYPSHDGLGFEPDDEEYEDYPPTSAYTPPSGRGTPLGPRRNNAMSMPPERDQVPGYDRPRAQTEDVNGPVMAQWRTNGAMLPPPPPPPSNGLPPAPLRPITPRLTSNASFSSAGVRAQQPQPPRGLRSQFSSTKLKSVYDNGGDVRSRAASPMVSLPPQPMSRSRSASQPQPYNPPKSAVVPPLPTDSTWSRSNTSMGSNGKRGSGSSQSTDSTDSSPNSSSPITPFGSSESSLGNAAVRSRSQHFSNGSTSSRSMIKVKIVFGEDIFVIESLKTTSFNELMGTVTKKIRLCGPRGEEITTPLRLKYRDDEDDLISISSTEDITMAFELIRPGGQVTLFVFQT